MRFYIGTAQLKKVLGVGLKPDLQGDSTLGPPRKWTPLKSKVVPPGGLFEALIANAVFLCDADALLHWNSAAEEGAWGGLKTGPPRRHQIQPVEGPVLDPRAKETYLKRGQKVDPLEIKSGPPWRVQFWPLHCGKSVEAFISS